MDKGRWSYSVLAVSRLSFGIFLTSELYFLLSKGQTVHYDLVSSIFVTCFANCIVKQRLLCLTMLLPKKFKPISIGGAIAFLKLCESYLDIIASHIESYLDIIASHIELLNTFYFLCG